MLISAITTLNELYELTKDLHDKYQFNYICADFHNFEEAYITKPYYEKEEFKIHQLVFGTGGITKLDPRYNPTEERIDPKNFNGFKYNMQNRYSSDESLLDYSIPPKKSNGYGEIIINEYGLKYKFISIEPEKIDIWKQKYLKYKKKYILSIN